jgi:hypothetical protein
MGFNSVRYGLTAEGILFNMGFSDHTYLLDF